HRPWVGSTGGSPTECVAPSSTSCAARCVDSRPPARVRMGSPSSSPPTVLNTMITTAATRNAPPTVSHRHACGDRRRHQGGPPRPGRRCFGARGGFGARVGFGGPGGAGARDGGVGAGYCWGAGCVGGAECGTAPGGFVRGAV